MEKNIYYQLIITPDLFIVQNNIYSKKLIITRESIECFEVENFSFAEQGIDQSQCLNKDIFGFLGIIWISSLPFMIVGKILVHDIYEISGVELIPFKQKQLSSQEDYKYYEGVKKMFASGFYFSNTYSLTNSRQRQFQKSQQAKNEQEQLHDVRFYWNYNLYRIILEQNLSINSSFFIPVIQGYVFSQSIPPASSTDPLINYTLISRRSCLRAGTRFNCRGIDEKGNVANFVETEMIYTFENKLISYLQIRGSVPIFWEQSSANSIPILTQGKEAIEQSFLDHINEMVQYYQHVLFVNLLNKAKQSENLLITTLEHLFSNNKQKLSTKSNYTFFDQHEICKGGRYEKIDSMFILQIEKILQHYSFYYEQVNSKGIITKIESIQKGVVRTNCLDCLDRTNVMQSRIA